MNEQVPLYSICTDSYECAVIFMNNTGVLMCAVIFMNNTEVLMCA